MLKFLSGNTAVMGMGAGNQRLTNSWILLCRPLLNLNWAHPSRSGGLKLAARRPIAACGTLFCGPQSLVLMRPATALSPRRTKKLHWQPPPTRSVGRKSSVSKRVWDNSKAVNHFSWVFQVWLSNYLFESANTHERTAHETAPHLTQLMSWYSRRNGIVGEPRMTIVCFRQCETWFTLVQFVLNCDPKGCHRPTGSISIVKTKAETISFPKNTYFLSFSRH